MTVDIHALMEVIALNLEFVLVELNHLNRSWCARPTETAQLNTNAVSLTSALKVLHSRWTNAHQTQIVHQITIVMSSISVLMVLQLKILLQQSPMTLKKMESTAENPMIVHLITNAMNSITASQVVELVMLLDAKRMRNVPQTTTAMSSISAFQAPQSSHHKLMSQVDATQARTVMVITTAMSSTSASQERRLNHQSSTSSRDSSTEFRHYTHEYLPSLNFKFQK